MGIKKGTKRTWDIWKHKDESEFRKINVGIRLNREEHERLQNVKKKVKYTTADILLIGITAVENDSY
ncbi:hypothetical protein [Pseudostreptobacillus hongkongensis]|uniref:hypothetical protein n=1 Tax=Pseudostreptobacillus hongkongensis TaxID=1162717 RepID=UPI0008371DF1|nr:hypothetical protein [Pseudostreptobacillus hongkongensis]